MLELIPLSVDTDTSYYSVDQIPQDQRAFLDLYSAIYDIDGLPNLTTAGALLDELAGNDCYAIVNHDSPTAYAGVMSYYSDRRRDSLFLDGLVTAKRFRGMRTVGPFALGKLIDHAAALSVSNIRLQAKQAAVPFYERFGFVIEKADEELTLMSREV